MMVAQSVWRGDLQRTTPSANGQHLAIPFADQSRKARCGVDRKGMGMAERVIR